LSISKETFNDTTKYLLVHNSHVKRRYYFRESCTIHYNILWLQEFL